MKNWGFKKMPVSHSLGTLKQNSEILKKFLLLSKPLHSQTAWVNRIHFFSALFFYIWGFQKYIVPCTQPVHVACYRVVNENVIRPISDEAVRVLMETVSRDWRYMVQDERVWITSRGNIRIGPGLSEKARIIRINCPRDLVVLLEIFKNQPFHSSNSDIALNFCFQLKRNEGLILRT